ncbi:MAG: glycosyltransferase 87 family protein [Actinomycetota bacterium]
MHLPPAKDLLIAVLLLIGGIGPLLFFKFRSGFIPGDLDIYRTAGIMALHGKAPYGPHFGLGLRVDLPFTYPPFAAFAVILLGIQPARMAQVSWTAANLVMLGAMVWWLLRPSLQRWRLDHPAYMALAIAAFAWTIPMSQTIAYGQVNIFLALICLVDCTRLTRYRGVLIGIAAAIKVTPGLFAVYFAVTKQWGAALRSAAAFVICEGLAAAILPAGSKKYWFHLLWQVDRPGNPKKFFNQSINGLLYHLNWPHWLWLPGVALVAVAGLWRARKAHLQGCEVAAVGLVGLSAVLISPISWQHHAVWILMMFAALAAWATTPRRMVIGAVLLAAFIAPVPQIGSLMVNSHVATPLDYLLENSDILVFVAMLFVLPLVPVTYEERAREAVPAGASTG